MSCARIATVSFWKTTFGGSLGENIQIGGAQFVEKYDWEQPNRLLLVQTGDSIDPAQVFKAHAIPQGLCANLVNALTLFAKKQEDGDGLSRNLGKENRKGLTKRLA